MRILYLDCAMGVAGDMLSAALLELLPDPDAFVEKLNMIGMPHVRFSTEKVARGGISGTRMHVHVLGHEEGEEHARHAHGDNTRHRHDSHGHHTLAAIEDIVSSLAIPTDVRESVLEVYGLIAAAEGRAHGVPVSQVHFHEVGALDAVADIAAATLLFSELAPDRTVCSPVHVGSGTVRCAHGVLPVPAPATAYLLEGVPIYGGNIQGELCTPTGAALLRQFVTEFSSMPLMTPVATGYGAGSKDFQEAPNCMRAILGSCEEPEQHVCELTCNVDDMTGEAIGFAIERFLEKGALDAYTVPIGMKKSRPGTLICVLCHARDVDKMTREVFENTTTLGIRRRDFGRCVLSRRVRQLDTPYGPVRVKEAEGYGVRRSKIEHDDLARIAGERGISLFEATSLMHGCLD